MEIIGKKIIILPIIVFFIFTHSVIRAQQVMPTDHFSYPDSLPDWIWNQPEYDFPHNPYLLPVVFPEKIFYRTTISLDPVLGQDNTFPILKEETFSLSEYPLIDSLRLDSYRNYLNHNPGKIKYKVSDLKNLNPMISNSKENIFRKMFDVQIEQEKEDMNPIEKFLPKRRYWTLGGSSLIQFSQNYLSDNWYNGGVGNLNLLSVQKFSANYAKDKIKFNNQIEWKLTFYTNPNDTIRSFRITEDMIKTYSDFGIKAFKKWDYSTNLEIKTQLFKNYQENTKNVVSAPLSPVYVNMGILGMKYQLNKTYADNKHKKMNVTADISPLSIQYIHVLNKKVDPTRFGIEKGKRHSTDLGSTINSRFVMTFNRQITFSTRLKFFTNYEKVVAESENEMNFALSRFFSTRIYLYLRYDDTPGIKKDDTFGYFQLNEVLSFGFNFKF